MNYFKILILISIKWTKTIQSIFNGKRFLLWAILFEITNSNSTTTTTTRLTLKSQIAKNSPARNSIMGFSSMEFPGHLCLPCWDFVWLDFVQVLSRQAVTATVVS